MLSAKDGHANCGPWSVFVCTSRLETRIKEFENIVRCLGWIQGFAMKVNKTACVFSRSAWPCIRTIFLIPDNWWSILELADVTWYVIEGLDRCWRANRSCDLRIVAKDSSNQLVAGSIWSVPKNSGPMNIVLCCKVMIWCNCMWKCNHKIKL